MAVVSSLAQFTYTTPFGWFAVFVFLRTGSVWPAVAVHTFCNYMGVPSLSIGGPKWLSFVYYALLLGGSWEFYKLLWPLTESSNAFVQFS
jgi:prenyl protein peptidase